MLKGTLPAFLLGCLIAGSLACPESGDGPQLEKISSDCSEWCRAAYRVEDSKPVCADGCDKFVDLFKACFKEKKSCSAARVCAKEGLKEACRELGDQANVCEVGGGYAHNLMLDYCIDKEV